MIITGKMLSFGTSGAGNGGTPESGGDTLAKSQNGADIYDKAKFRRNIGVDGLTLSGPGVVYPGVTHEYTITGWSDFSAYDVSASTGMASIKNGVVTLSVPVDATEAITLTITRNDAKFGFTLEVSPVFILPPEITSPADGSIGVDFNATMAASDFACNKAGADTYLKTQWEISTGPGYYTDEEIAQAEFNGKPIQEYNVVAVRSSPGTTLVLDIPVTPVSEDSEEDLLNRLAGIWNIKYRPEDDRVYRVRRGATYRVRARHTGHRMVSGWSDYVTFTISNEPIARPVILSPASGETGVDAAPTFRASDFLLQHHAVDELKKSEWEIATDPAFTDSVWKGASADSAVTPPGNILKRSSVYYLRMRYEGRDMGCSDYSDTANFTTAVRFLPTKEIATLLQPDGAANAYFNVPAFSHDGDWLFVGAYGAYTGDDSDVSSGAVYAYQREGQTWTMAQIITPPQPHSYQYFGSSITFAGNSLFVVSGSNIYECTFQGGNWSPLPGAVTSKRYDNTSAEICVSQDGNTVAIQYYDWTSYSVKVLTRDAGAGAWSEVSIYAPARNLRFGEDLSISADGTVLAVGCPLQNGTKQKPLVCIFRLTGGAWKLEQSIQKPDSFPGGDFGRLVRISPDGSLLFAGGNENGFNNQGAIYAWHYVNGKWEAADTATIKDGVIDFKYVAGMLVCVSDGGTVDNITHTGVGFYDTEDGHLKLKASTGVTKKSRVNYSAPRNAVAVSDDRSTLALGVADNTQGDYSNAVVIFTEGGATE